MAFSQIKIDPTDTVAEVETLIQTLESPFIEFVGIFETGHFPSPNVLFFKAHDTPVTPKLPKLQLLAVDPDINAEAATNIVNAAIDKGLTPLKEFFDINLIKGEVTVLAFRGDVPLRPVAAQNGFITTRATVFGLNMDGTFDSEDNGMGAPVLGSINTRDPMLVGVAIPIRLCKQQFGSLQAAKGKFVEVTHLANNATIKAQIVDLGPSEGQIAKGIALDLTLGAQKALQGDGLIDVKYRFL